MRAIHCAWTVSVVAGLLAACGDDDPLPVGNGGTGGATGGSAGMGGSGGGGSAGQGGSAGMAGAAGNGGSGGEAPARFTAAVGGEVLVLTPLDPVWVQRCSEPIQGLQRSNGSWTVLQDDRPEAFGGHYAAHYVGNSYYSDCRLNLGCDVSVCAQLEADGQPQEPWERLQAPSREYVQVGQARAPLCGEEDAGTDSGALDAGPDAGGRLVPLLESRAPTGQLGVRVRYFRNNLCNGTPLTTEVAVE